MGQEEALSSLSTSTCRQVFSCLTSNRSKVLRPKEMTTGCLSCICLHSLAMLGEKITLHYRDTLLQFILHTQESWQIWFWKETNTWRQGLGVNSPNVQISLSLGFLIKKVTKANGLPGVHHREFTLWKLEKELNSDFLGSFSPYTHTHPFFFCLFMLPFACFLTSPGVPLGPYQCCLSLH